MSDYVGRHRPPTRTERSAQRRQSRLPRGTHLLSMVAASSLALTVAGAAATHDGFGAAEEAPAAEASATATTEPSSETWSSERRETGASTFAPAARDERREQLGRDEQSTWEPRPEESAEDRPDQPEWVAPVGDDIRSTSGYGKRWGRLHAGQDYATPVGTPLKAMGSGKVVESGTMGGYGKHIDIRYSDGTVSRYGHLSGFEKTQGHWVRPGEVVARSGNSGRSTGPHLHLEIRPGGKDPVDPAPWMTERGIG